MKLADAVIKYTNSLVTQRIRAEREDGHNKAGLPGDCFKCCVCTVMGLSYQDVPHFALYLSWWDTLRRWMLDNHDSDWAYFTVENGQTVRDFVPPDTKDGLYIACGPSPRGSFRHCVVVDIDLSLVWDPHPSRKGLERIDDVFIWTFPYLPGPNQLLLTP